MEYSENYGLALPQDEDGFDIGPISENFQEMDEILAEQDRLAAEISEKIGEPAESGQTLFSLLGQKSGGGLTGIRSIQRIVYTLATNKAKDSVSIEPVTAANCIGIFDLHYTTYEHTPKVLYTIKDTEVEFEFSQNSANTTIVGLWIVEFM